MLRTAAWVLRTRCRTSADPMKPAPPVTRMRSLRIAIRKARIRKEIRKLGKPGQCTIPLGQDRFLGIDWPGDANFRGVPGNTASRLRIVISRHLVDDLGIGIEHRGASDQE